MAFSNAANQTDFAQTKDDIFSGFIVPDLAEDYFKAAQRTSVIQQLARKVPLGPSGVKVPHFNKSNVSAAWVAEGEAKPTTKGSLSLKYIQPHKIAAIIVDSAEVVRLNPGNYITYMQEAVGEAIGRAFDNAVLHGDSTPFASYLDQTTKAQELASASAYDDLAVDGLSQLVTHKNPDGFAYRWTGTALDVVTEPLLNAAVDTQGRPLFNEAVYTTEVSPVRGGAILGRPTFVTDQIAKGTGAAGALQAGDSYGYMGDFSQMVWGQIGGISYSVSNEASVTLGGELVSLWQHNLIAILVEAEYGLLINDLNAFVKLTVPATP